jgi:hypothetical protein
MAVRNIDSFRKLFRAVASLPELLVDEKGHIVDEIAFRRPLLDLLERNRYKININRYFCDIVPECFFGLFRQHYAQRKKNFLDSHCLDGYWLDQRSRLPRHAVGYAAGQSASDAGKNLETAPEETSPGSQHVADSERCGPSHHTLTDRYPTAPPNLP